VQVHLQAIRLIEAQRFAEAIAMARSTMGRSAQITMLHHPPYMISDVM